MTIPTQSRYEIDVSDVEYIRHGDKPLLARLYRPQGKGPFPLIVDLHGGAWCTLDRTANSSTDAALARSGVIVAALDFRMPPEAHYPASMADINYAIRWLKGKAVELDSRPDMIGILGVSSGGHQGMLAAMRPDDPRYAALPLPDKAGMDATVRCVVLCWPVIDPLGRYHYVKKILESGNSSLPDEHDWIACHDQYWLSEVAMAEGNPTLMLERGEPVKMPPVLYLQGTHDKAHPRENLDRFVAGYRKAGGRVDLQWFEGVGHAFISKDPNAPTSIAAIRKIIEFVHHENSL